MSISRFAFVAALVLGAGTAAAQHGFRAGIASGGAIQGAFGCGFDCSNLSNVVQATTAGGSTLDYQLQGDAGALAILAMSIGPVGSACPGVTFGGISNSLLLNPAPTHTVIVALSTSLMATPNATCGSSGGERLLQFFVLPAWLTGHTLSFQGFVFDNGVPTFTRPLEIAIV